MDKDSNDILELRLYGDGISPTSFKSKDVAVLLVELEVALKHYIFTNHPEIDPDELFISPIAIQNDSLGLSFSPNVKNYFAAAFLTITTCISSNDFSSLPIHTIHALQKLQKIVRIKNCNAEFKKDGVKLADISPNTVIQISKDIIKADTIVYGYVTKVGGNDPKAWVIINGKRIIISLTKAVAKELSHKLYEEVGFKGTATFSRGTREVLEFKVSSIIAEYNPGSIKESFNEIKNIIGKYWDNVDNVDETLLKE